MQQLHPAAHEKRNRRIENFLEARRIPRIRNRDQKRAGLEHLLLLVYRIVKSASARDGLREASREPISFQIGTRGAEDRLRRSKLLEHLAGFARAEARDQ